MILRRIREKYKSAQEKRVYNFLGFTPLEKATPTVPSEWSLPIKANPVRNKLSNGVREQSSLTGFTMIELIIVIIIIAILATIAVPMYDKTVEHSRITEALSTLNAIHKAQMRYALENDVYATDLTDLDINVTSEGEFFNFNLDVVNVFSADPYDDEDDFVARAGRNGMSVGGGYHPYYMVDIYESGEFLSHEPGGGGGGNVPDPPGCFLAGTLITMANGTQKPIEEIQVGDIVLAFNENTGQIEPDTVTKAFSHPGEDTYLIINRTLKVTSAHRVLSKGKWVKIKDLKIGDTLTNAQGEDVVIFDIVEVKESVEVYNFETNSFHTYIANGFIVHNIKMEP